MSSHELKLLAFYDELIPTLDDESSRTVPRLLATLCARFDLGAVSLYTVSETGQSAIFRAQHGLDLSKYQSLERTKPKSAVVRAITQQKIIEVSDIRVHGLEEPEQAIAKGWTAAIVFPLPRHNPTNGTAPAAAAEVSWANDAAGALCAYLRDPSALAMVRSKIERALPFISACYAISLRNDRLALRDALLEKALGSRDLNSSLHRAIVAAKQYVSFEGASVFLWDKARALLRLHASTGLEGVRRKEDVMYTADDDEWTVHVARTGQAHCSGELETRSDSRRHREATLHATQSMIALPIRDWRAPNAREEPPVGVLRAVNRIVVDDSQARIVSFSWEDAERLRLVADVMGFVTAVFAKADARVLEFERVMHGARSNVEAALQNLHVLTEREGLVSVHDSRVEYVIPDSISHLEVVKAQIERLESWEQRTVVGESRIRLFADVLVKARNYVRRISRSFDVKQLRLTDLEEAGFPAIPFVKGDAEALSIVFRNLFENALKYSDPRATVCEIILSYEVLDDYVIVRISDNGMGIDSVDAKAIFVEGFRGERAIRRRGAGGSGIGLAQSLGLMRRMNGDLQLEKLRPTTFCVKMVKWRDKE